MPVYLDNKIEDFIAKKSLSDPEQPVFTAKKKVEQVNSVLGTEPGRVPINSIEGEQPINEGKPIDLMRGNIVSCYS